MTSQAIPASTISHLRELLVRMVRDESQATASGALGAGSDVRRALRELCADARVNGVRVEQIMIAIKQGWSSLHSDHPRTRVEGPDEMLNQVITSCIDEFYLERQQR